MTSSTAELALIADEELERLAEQNGPTSAEAQVLAQLTTQRLQDLQVHAFAQEISTSPDLCRERLNQQTWTPNFLRH